MAVVLPGSSFVGIDSSAGQVAEANAAIKALGLENVAIERRDLVELGEGSGSFDYIIAHGVYSWVDAPVRSKILETLASRLALGGLLYLSYNTYPGWRLRSLVRDLMAYRARRYERPADRAREARRALEFVASSATPFDRAYAGWLGDECRYVRERSDSYLLHDHLEEDNEPVYFHDFVDRAKAAGLRFVSEVQAGVLDVESLPTSAAAGLADLAEDEVEFEQYLDFLINRKFRQSVFCLAGRGPSRAPHAEELARLGIAARPPITLPMATFRDEARLRSVLERLAAAWPLAIPWGSLAQTGWERSASDLCGADAIRDDPDLTADLLRCYRLKVVEFWAHRLPFVSAISDRPLASPMARYQASLGETVTNLRHESGRLDDFGRTVLRHLDGRRDRDEILGLLRGSRFASRSRPTSHVSSSSCDAPEAKPDRVLEVELDRCLQTLARYAFLMN